MKPMVSILIPAYNAEAWISDTLRSAVAQTWERKEIIVVDDGSKDKTLAVARQFESSQLKVVTQRNQGAAAARNYAFSLSKGDYIQYLDADDLLSPEKIERQMAAIRETNNRRVLLSSQWAYFNYRADRARFLPTSLWHDLSPVEWMLRKLGEGLYMQTATWLTSRELAEAAGTWDTRLLSDDDVEYFCRVLLASEGTRFVPEATVFYRFTPSSRLSYIGTSDEKKDALLLSIKLQIEYARSLEDSERVHKACLAYLRNRLNYFYPERLDILADLQALAEQLGGHLEEPRLRWKYAWMRPIFGFKFAKQAQMLLPYRKASLIRSWDKMMHGLEIRRASLATSTAPKNRPQELDRDSQDEPFSPV